MNEQALADAMPTPEFMAVVAQMWETAHAANSGQIDGTAFVERCAQLLADLDAARLGSQPR